MEPVAECDFIAVRVPEKRQRKNLVIVAGGDASLHSQWLKDLPDDARIPAESGASLRKCQPAFSVNPTGGYIDWVWAPILGNPNNRIAIPASVPMRHC